jgi:uncharacterized protein DUF3185
VKTKLSVTGIGIGIILILFGFVESNILGSDGQMFFSGSTRETAIFLLAGGAVIISGGVLAFARAVSE